MKYYLVQWYREAFDNRYQSQVIPAKSAAQVRRLMRAAYGDLGFTVKLLLEIES